MQKPGEFGPFKFLWKMKLEHDPQASPTLTEPILLDRLIGFRGFKSIAFVGTASETVHAIDLECACPCGSTTSTIGKPSAAAHRCPVCPEFDIAMYANRHFDSALGGGAGDEAHRLVGSRTGERGDDSAAANRGRGAAQGTPPAAPVAPPQGR